MNDERLIEVYKSLPRLGQREDAVADQLADIRIIANRLGMYEVADAIEQWVKNLPRLDYGCHCDLEPGMEPDECVLDTDEPAHCIYANKIRRKEECDYWQIIRPQK